MPNKTAAALFGIIVPQKEIADPSGNQLFPEGKRRSGVPLRAQGLETEALLIDLREDLAGDQLGDGILVIDINSFEELGPLGLEIEKLLRNIGRILHATLLGGTAGISIDNIGAELGQSLHQRGVGLVDF